MTSSASPAKKRNRAKSRQKRKEKAKQQLGSDYSSPDEEIPPNEPYGPWKEPKRQWDARLMVQMPSDRTWADFQRRAKTRAGKPILYQPAAIPEDQILLVDDLEKFGSTPKQMLKIVFAPHINVDNSVIDVITQADPAFLRSLRVFIAGNPERTQNIDITDAGVDKLIKACPSLQIIALHGVHNLTRVAFPNILKCCKEIESVTITLAKGNTSRRTRLNGTLDWLTDKSFVPKLRYLEFRGLYISGGPIRVRFLEFLTKCRPALEIVYEYDEFQVLIRDMSRTPLSHVPDTAEYKSSGGSKGKAKYVEEESEEDSDEFDYQVDEDLISDDPRANARMLSRLGQQNALSDALGRDLYDFELDDDYAGYDDIFDDDEEIDPKQMRTILAAMEAMKGGSRDYY